MFLKLKKEAVAYFDLCAAGPVIISGKNNNKTDFNLPDISFLNAIDENGKTIYVVPGSTIKGVIRHYIENKYIKDESELFGKVKNGAHKSRVSFFDAYAVMDTIETRIRYSTAINNVAQSAQNGTLNNIQTIERGTFKAGFKIVNFSCFELEKILESLLAINDREVFFGGRTSRGYGRMQVKNFSITVNEGYNSDFVADVKKFDVIDNAIEYVRGEK